MNVVSHGRMGATAESRRGIFSSAYVSFFLALMHIREVPEISFSLASKTTLHAISLGSQGYYWQGRLESMFTDEAEQDETMSKICI
jgi:hypothetical protein